MAVRAPVLFPKFFTVTENQSWLRGEGGLLPTAGYVVVGLAVFVWMQWRGPSWRTLVRQALT